MIVDVLRNDLGRVCRPGERPRARGCAASSGPPRSSTSSRRVDRPPRGRATTRSTCSPRASRAGRSRARPRSGRWRSSSELEPVARGPYTGALGWIGPDGAMATSILIRTFVADGAHLTPPRRRRHHLAERPGRRMGRDRGEGARAAARDRRRSRSPHDGRERTRAHLDRRPDRCPPAARTCRSSTAASSWATASSRRSASGRDHPTELDEHLARLRGSADGLGIPLPARSPTPGSSSGDRRPPRRGGARRSGRRCVGPDHREPRRRSSAAALLPPGEDVGRRRSSIQAWPVAPPPARSPRARPPPHRDAPCGAIRRARSRRSRPRRARITSSPGSRRAGRARTTRCSSRSTGASRRARPRTSSSSAADELATPRARDCAILAGHDPVVAAGLGGHASGCAPIEGRLTTARPRRGRRGVPVQQRGRDPAGDPVRRGGRSAAARPVRGRARARADREAFIRGRRADDPGRAGRPDPPARRRGRPAASRRRRCARSRSGSSCSDDLLAAAWGIDGPLPPRVAHGRQAEAHRPRPSDDARRGGRLRPRGRRGEDRRAADEPRRGRAPGHAVPRRGGVAWPRAQGDGPRSRGRRGR